MLLNHIGTGLAKSALVVLALLWAVGCSNGNDEDIAQKLGGGPTRQTATPTTTTDGEAAWTLQFGTEDDDLAWGVIVDAEGNVYVVGEAGRALPDLESLGGTDAFLRKYSKDGGVIWTRQFGTDDFDQVWDIAAGRDGDLYLVGSTGGSFQGHQGQGDLDGFVARYDGDGDQVWVRQFGDWQV